MADGMTDYYNYLTLDIFATQTICVSQISMVGSSNIYLLFAFRCLYFFRIIHLAIILQHNSFILLPSYRRWHDFQAIQAQSNSRHNGAEQPPILVEKFTNIFMFQICQVLSWVFYH